MNLATIVSTDSRLSMTSREIADLVGSRHDNVRTTIERLADRGTIQLPAMQEVEKINSLGLPQRTKVYVFPGYQGKRDSLVVVAQLSPEFTARIVDRWQELEAQLAAPQPPTHTFLEHKAEAVVLTSLNIARALQIPEHIGQIEAIKDAKRTTGLDYSHYLALSPAQDNIKLEDEMLEPTALGARFGLAGQKVNKLLAAAGLQVKEGDSWTATPAAANLCSRHAWTKGPKSGYNYKWRVSAVSQYLTNHATT